jgi:hypothetical protein
LIQLSITGWFEIVEATNKSAISIQDLFHNTWLVRYPRPQFIVLDNGDEFKRMFKQMCVQDNYGIKAKPTTSHNQQTTSMQSLRGYTKLVTVNDMLRLFDLGNEINHENLEEQEDNPFYYFLQSSAWATRSTYHTYNIVGNTMSTCVW